MKESSAKSTAAYAAQTGKGLWFYSKDEGHKDAPHGIVKLADVSDVVPVGATKFVLKLTAGELQFEAPAADRDNWIYTLKTKVEEAKASETAVTESEGYKAAVEKFSKFSLNTSCGLISLTGNRSQAYSCRCQGGRQD